MSKSIVYHNKINLCNNKQEFKINMLKYKYKYNFQLIHIIMFSYLFFLVYLKNGITDLIGFK